MCETKEIIYLHDSDFEQTKSFRHVVYIRSQVDIAKRGRKLFGDSL
jgi:hypothetical protein